MRSKKELVEYYRTILGQDIAKTPWIVALDVLVGAAHLAKILRELGAKRILVIGAVRGVGEIPEDLECINLELGQVKSMMAGIQRGEAALENLPDWVLERVEAFDPKKEARVMRAFFSNEKPIAGRPVFGARRDAWSALEDKMIVDDLWDAIGISRAPRELVTLDDSALFDIAHQLDQGAGTVWVGDNRDGWHGGAERMRWVQAEEEMPNAKIFLSQFSDRVRVMPFLEGIPCSIHGWVFPDKTIAFRPCEMLVFQIREQSKFFYAGAATNWKPKELVRKTMVDIAIQTGEDIFVKLLAIKDVLPSMALLRSRDFSPRS